MIVCTRNRALRLLQVSGIAVTACLGLSCRADVARPGQGYAGTWVMTLGQRVFIVLTIESNGDIPFEERNRRLDLILQGQ